MRVRNHKEEFRISQSVIESSAKIIFEHHIANANLVIDSTETQHNT